jgi:hypothetical protein
MQDIQLENGNKGRCKCKGHKPTQSVEREEELKLGFYLQQKY